MTRADKLPNPGKNWGYDKSPEPKVLTLQEVADALQQQGVTVHATVQTRMAGRNQILTGTVEDINMEEDRVTIHWLDGSKVRWSFKFTLYCLEGLGGIKLQVI